MRSAVLRGHRFELFTYDEDIRAPAWVARRDAREILPASRVLVYRNGIGAGSPALHANVFRYEMMHQLGGWWVDLDMLVLRADLPRGDEFYACDPRGVVLTGVLRFPAGSPLLAEAIRRCQEVGEDTAAWGQTGPELITDLVAAFGREGRVASAATAYALDHGDLEMVFDPARCEEMEKRIEASSFLHLYNELRRRAGFPREAGPPPGSYLDRLFKTSGLDITFPYRLQLPELRRWLNNHFDANTYKTLYETRQPELKGEFEREFERRALALEQQSAIIRELERRLAPKGPLTRLRAWRRQTQDRVRARLHRLVD
ncbi:hypothetical protein SSBR45G_36170 [Bradyrhizobium sp. SSBR45G]|uniref:hypothetical protein n=1 Tax=unclassified Bradyrhizobium TaxID=2631580 RepID=UPI0023429802|nr:MULTISPECIES: hypothetical protein [unclassified Bradyrhizobium]GLH78708.1 hypothetical protein SSBR45G_36170 [Bradyrhizobium sp. SSBR45G]GLH87464.1 hypothetical protein SSBR45R_49240 [Bradyrhizobium sp. SSBR45R]